MRWHSESRIKHFGHRCWADGLSKLGSVFAGVTSGLPENRATRAADMGRVAQSVTRNGSLWLLTFLVGFGMLATPIAKTFAAPPPAQVDIGVSVSFGPPPLPYYEQPFCPGPGYIWTPGYWAWDPDYGYYWVPGTWVPAPFEGALWTPGYWGWGDGVFIWHEGYWGPVVGFYGGIPYGYGYTGYGYEGGYWRGRDFYYNRSVNNVHVTNITNVYNKTVIQNVNVTRVSYNGGQGGIVARPTPAQLAAANQRRYGPVNEQMRQVEFARTNPQQRASINHGAPAVAATPKPGVFRGNGVVMARRAGAAYREPPINRAATRPFSQKQALSAPAGWHSFSKAPGRGAPPSRAADNGRGRAAPASPAYHPYNAPPRRNEASPTYEPRQAPQQREAAPRNPRPSAVPQRSGKPPEPANKHEEKKPPEPHDQRN